MANRAEAVPVRPGTRFGLASLTKMFTAVATADLVRQGALGFHTPVVNVLPSDRRPATLRADVTVHHLLSHTSGVADYYEEEDEHEGSVALTSGKIEAGLRGEVVDSSPPGAATAIGIRRVPVPG
jgi:CubicO group peptidase (beta-lactamase class C family)